MPAGTWEWLQLLVVVALPGIFNLIVAFEKFNRKCRSPFFNPWTSLGLWWWVLLQLSLPTIFFWLLYGTAIKPPPSADLVTKAITFGLGFLAFVNANIDLGFTGVPLGDLYFWLTQLAYRQMAASQTGKLAAFTSDLEEELRQNTINLNRGLTYLENYFLSDFALKYKEVEQQKLLDRVRAARTHALSWWPTKHPSPEQINEIVSLILEMRGRDCFTALQRFGCRAPFLKQYFPKQLPKP